MKHVTIVVLATLLALTGCKKKTRPTADEPQAAGVADEEKGAQDAAGEASTDAGSANSDVTAETVVVSEEILERDPVADSVLVKHVLLSWDDKASIYANRGGQDERGAQRSKAEANRLALELKERASGDDAEDFDALMAEYSEDKGSNKTGRAYPVTADAGLVQNFKDLALRLEPGEVGIVESVFGYHIMKRTE